MTLSSILLIVFSIFGVGLIVGVKSVVPASDYWRGWLAGRRSERRERERL